MSTNDKSTKNNDGFDEVEAQFFQSGEVKQDNLRDEIRQLSDEFEDEDFATADVTIDDINIDDIYMPVDSSEISAPPDALNVKKETEINQQDSETPNSSTNTDINELETQDYMESPLDIFPPPEVEVSDISGNNFEDTLGDVLEPDEPEMASEFEDFGSSLSDNNDVSDFADENHLNKVETDFDLYVPSAPIKAVQDLVQCFLLEAEEVSDSMDKGSLYSEAGLMLYQILRDKNAAYLAYGKADNAYKLDTNALRHYADISAKKGELELSAELLERWARSVEKIQLPSALLDVALFEMTQLNRPYRAVSLLQQALDVDAENWNVLRTLSHLLDAIEDWDELIKVYEKMAALTDGPIASYYFLEAGLVFEHNLHNPQEALNCYRSSFEANSEDGDAFNAYERMLRHLDKTEERISLYLQKSVSAVGVLPLWLNHAAMLAVDTNDIERATTILADSTNYFKSLLFQKQNATHEYQSSLESLINASHAEQKIYASWRLGKSYLDSGDSEKALAAFRVGSSENSKIFPFTEEIIRILLANSDFDEISQYVVHNLESVDDNSFHSLIWEAYLLKAAVLNNRETEFLSRSRNSVFRHLNSLLLIKEKRWQEAFDLFCEEAHIRQLPSFYVLAANIAENYLNDEPQALGCYQRAQQLLASQPDNLSIIINFHLRRLAASTSDWSNIATQLQSQNSSEEELLLLGMVYWVFLDDIEAASNVFFSILSGSQQEPALALLIAMLPNSDKRITEALSQSSHHFTPESNEWNDLLIARDIGEWGGSLPKSLAEWISQEQKLNGEDNDVQYNTLVQGVSSPNTNTVVNTVKALTYHATENNDSRVFDVINSVSNHLVKSDSLKDLIQALESIEDYATINQLLSKTRDTHLIVEKARLAKHISDSEEDEAALWIQAYNKNKDDISIAFQAHQFLIDFDSGHAQLLDIYVSLANQLNVNSKSIGKYFSLAAGHFLKFTGDTESAIQYFKQVFDLDKFPNKAFNGLNDIYITTHQVEDLKLIFENLESSNPLLFAESLERMREFNSATKEYENIYHLSMEDTNSFNTKLIAFRVIRCAEYAGLWDLAAFHLRQLLETWSSSKGRRYLNSKLHWILVEHLADSEQALETFTYLHEQDPNDLEILESLARITGEHGDTEKAVGYLQQLAINAKTPLDAAKYYRHIASAYYTVKKSDEAKTALLDALDLNPTDTQAINTLKSIYTDSENYDDLIALLTREANLYESEKKLVCLQKIANIRQTIQKDYSLAINAWSKVLDLSPNNVNALTQLVDITDIQGDAESMASYSEALLPLLDGENRLSLQHRLGIVYYSELSQYEPACSMLEETVQNPEYQHEASAALSDIYEQSSNWRSLVALYQQMSETQTEKEKATEYLKKAIDIAIKHIGEHDLIFSMQQRYATYDENDMDSIVYCAQYNFGKNDFATAIPFFERAADFMQGKDLDDFDIRLDVVNYFYSFGICLSEENQPQKALTEFDRVLNLNRGHLPALERMGPLLLELKLMERAETVYRTILELTAGQNNNPLITTAYVSLGKIELYRGRLDKAKSRLSNALKNDPTSLDVMIVMADVMFQLGEWNALFKAYNTIISSCSESEVVTNAYYMKAFVLDKKMGKTEKAVQHHLKSLEIKDRQPKVFLRLSEIYLRNQKYSDSIQAAGRGIACTEDNDILAPLYLLRTCAEQHSGNSEFASELYGHAIEQNPQIITALGDELPDEQRLKAYLHDLLEEAI